MQLFLYVCKQTFRKSKVRISQEVKGIIMHNLCGTIFYIKAHVLQDFHICMSVPLRTLLRLWFLKYSFLLNVSLVLNYFF